MKLTKMKLAMLSALGLTLSSGAFALDLYMDSETKQLFAEDGPGRIKLGTFEKVEDKVKQQEEIAEIRNDLKNKDQEFKELEEHVVAVREANAKNDEKWFNKINLRGYTQLRYNQKLTGDRVAGQPELRSNEGDKSIKDNSNFSFRRVRLVFSGDINEYVSLYIQPDFATNTSSDGQNFAQLRDAYADLAFDKTHEYRIRAGQSKVPFGWENLQSSQNRLSLDRADALNSAVPSERDLGLFAYWSPTHVQKLWKDLSLKGLKTSGDYGVLGFGVYNGQGLNREEANDDLYMVAHATYPIELDFLGSTFNGQVLEVGADAISGKFNVSTREYTTFDGVSNSRPASDRKGNSEDRVAVHAILFPQPFGLQAEWNWGKGPTLNVTDNVIERQTLNGGYVQAMYKIDKILGTQGTLIPFVKWQLYDGPHKGAANSAYTHVEEIDFGFEWQMMKALELVMTYTMMDRTNTVIGNDYLGQASGDLLRTQLQWNY